MKFGSHSAYAVYRKDSFGGSGVFIAMPIWVKSAIESEWKAAVVPLPAEGSSLILNEDIGFRIAKIQRFWN
jgi:hypothetical protein